MSMFAAAREMKRRMMPKFQTIGLDISDRSVKFIELRRVVNGFAVGSFGEFAVPDGVIVDGEIRNEAELVRLLRGAGIGKRPVVASLPDEHGVIRLLDLPDVPPRELAHAVRWEVEGLMPMPLHAVAYDYHSIPDARTAVHENALVVAYPRVICDSYQRVLAAAGLTTIALEPESQAIVRAAVPAGIKETILVADIGAVRTSLAMTMGGSVVSASNLPIGGKDMESAIARGFGVSLEKARAIKIDAGLGASRYGGRVHASLSGLLEKLAAGLADALRFHPGADASAVYLCGGDANLIGLEKYLAVALKRPVMLADPFANAGLAPGAVPPIPRRDALRYAAAIGLALRGAEY